MPVPGFPAGTLSKLGFPVWIKALWGEDPHFMIHVVRGLTPAGALAAAGARPATFTPYVLPGGQSDGQPPPVPGRPGHDVVLLAGQVGPWTFLYDIRGDTGYREDSGQPSSGVTMAEILSAAGREAASGTFTVEAGTSLVYAVDGRLLLHAAQEVDPETDDIPAGLQAAVAAAGRFESAADFLLDGPDMAVNIRVVCALAGLALPLEDLHAIPLTGAPLGVSDR